MKKIFFIIITIFLLTNVSMANERFIPLELFTGGDIRDDREIRYTPAAVSYTNLTLPTICSV